MAEAQKDIIGTAEEESKSYAGGKIGKNSLFLVLRTVLIMLVSLYTSRLALRFLGQTDFGIYYLVAAFVIFFGFLNVSMERAITRFFIYEKSTGTEASLQKLFNVALITQFSIVAVVIVAAETIGLYYINHYTNIPANKIFATNWVYQLSVITLAFNIVKVPYNAMIIAFEKMSFYAFFGLGEVILRLLAVLSLVLFSRHLLIIYSAQFLLVTVVAVYTYKLYCTHARVFGRVCRFRWFWQKDTFVSLITFSGWNTLGSCATMGAFQGTSLILNRYFGVVANAAFGIMAMLQQATYGILTSFQTAYSPQLVTLYARRSVDKLREFIYSLGKYSFYIASALLVPVCMNINLVLRIWLGNDAIPTYTAAFCVLCLVSNGIDCVAAPGLVCNQATGRIKIYNIFCGVIMLSTLPLVWVTLKFTGVAATAFVVRCIIASAMFIFTIILMRRQIGLSAVRYIYVAFLRPLIILLPSFAVSWWIYSQFDSDVYAAIASILSFWVLEALTVLFLGLTKTERQTLFSRLRPVPAS